MPAAQTTLRDALTATRRLSAGSAALVMALAGVCHAGEPAPRSLPPGWQGLNSLERADFIADFACTHELVNALVSEKVTQSAGLTAHDVEFRKYSNRHATVYWHGPWERQQPPAPGDYLPHSARIDDLLHFRKVRFLAGMSPGEIEGMFHIRAKTKTANAMSAYGEGAYITFNFERGALHAVDVNCSINY